MTNTGIWDQDEAQHHVVSDDLTMKLQVLIDPGMCIIDMGCGRGDYIRNLLDENYECCVGVEGTKLPQHKGMDIRNLDLSLPIVLGTQGDVISFEVGEHIPKDYEQTFIDNLTNHCTGRLILSWGLPNQIGIGHVNCQPQEYIIEEIERRGFVFNKTLTDFIRDAKYINAPWFKDTLMVFDKW